MDRPHASADRPVAPPLAELRIRNSAKWRTYPDDVLPLFIAEMDYPLAPVVAEAMIDQIRRSDLGYADGPADVAEAFAGFADRRWGWRPGLGDIRITTDVSVVIVEALRVAIAPGDGVIINPPVYPPFFDLIPEAGGEVVQVPLLREPGWALDLDGIEAAFAAGAKALLLCHPHNPLGLVHPRADLEAVAELADRYGAIVVSDEIHAPLTHPGVEFTPFLSLGDTARRVGIAAHSASKAFNLAGTKCAISVASSPETAKLLDAQPEEVGLRASILGRAATAAGFADGEPWLDGVLATITDSFDLLEELLARRLPGVTLRRPAASYLAWLDFRGTGLGDDPAEEILRRGRVALHSGPAFGTEGAGFARLNVACSPEVLTEAVDRIAGVLAAE